MTKEEHGMFFDAMHRLGLSSEVKESAVALYLDFKTRPVGEYNADEKRRSIFLVASISLAAKALGDLRTDQEFETRMFVSREKLVDAEERILKSLGVENETRPSSEFISQLTRRQIESMADGFVERDLMTGDEGEQLVELSCDYLEAALQKGLNTMVSYRGRAAGVMFKAVRDLGFQISERDVANAAGFDRKTMLANANIIRALLNDDGNPKNQKDSGVRSGEPVLKRPAV